MNITGNVFVVTGAGNGIGREVTRILLASGASVAGVDLNESTLAATAALVAAGSRFSSHVVDITSRDEVLALPAAVLTEHGQIDGLVNIAGVIQKFVKIIDLPFEEIEKVMNVNFWGTVNMVKAFLPILVERPEASLVNVASMGAYAPVPGQAVYGASKAAVRLLTEALYAELLDTNVSVTSIFPGAIATDIATNSGVALSEGSSTDAPAFKMTTATDAGNAIVAAIRKGSFRATIGKDAAAMDKLARLSPKHAARTIAKQMGSLLS
ncbi:SDR family NAD(P)-dependent oxidoreductase [Microbacterium sp. NPDC055910]|uniref:SDR family NAD(P)-dependent oxidoreductase n=1 Tax=Microbacterium sp. NPDC055910 TaxID=3345659 RepID=UPI0035D6F698